MVVNWWRITFSHISTNQRRCERLKHSEKPIQFLQICNNANLQNVQRVQYVLYQIPNVANTLRDLPKQFLQICNNANIQNVQRVQNVLHQISNMAAALINLPKQLPAPLPQNHSCHQSDLQWRRHKVVHLPALEEKKKPFSLNFSGMG